MKFVLTVDLDNAATQTVHGLCRVIRQLEPDVASRAARGSSVSNLLGCDGEIRDINGNTIGHWEVKGEHDDNDG